MGRPSVNFWIIFYSIIYSLSADASSSHCEAKKGLECGEGAAVSSTGLTLWAVLCGPRDGVCQSAARLHRKTLEYCSVVSEW